MKIKITISKVAEPLEGASYGRTDGVFDQTVTVADALVEDVILDMIEGIQKVAREDCNRP